jgi:ketosteroid isomerase-like protein
MSQEYVELHRRAIDAFNRRDLDAFLALTDPDVEFISRIVELEGGGPYRGHDGIRRWWEDLFGVFPDFSAKVEEVQDLGDVTVTRVRQHSQGVESDAPADQTQWIVTEWRHQKAIWWGTFLSEAEAIDAAGLRE